MKNVYDIFQRKGRQNITVSPDARVVDALKLMAEKNIGSIVVLSGDQFKGLFTERDYARKVILQGKSSSELMVSEIMSDNLPEISLEHRLDDCMEIMTSQNVRYRPVFDKGQFIGIISIIDVVRETILAQKETIDQLHNYIHS